MKKLLLAVILATTLMSSSYANEKNKVSWLIAENFKKEFYEADDVNWTVKKDYVKASFTEDGLSREAFYNHEGELISTSTKLNLSDLPTETKRAFAKKYSNYTVLEAVKLEGLHDVAYYLSVENDAETLILKAWNSSITVFRKTEKNK